MVMVLDAHEAVTPLGRRTGASMPVAPVVAMFIAVRGVLIHKVDGDVGVVAVFTGVTVIVPMAFIVPHPPLKGML